jgi:HEAT repeat protein
MIAALALGRIKDPKAINSLKKALDDEDEDVRETAKEALEKIQKK